MQGTAQKLIPVDGILFGRPFQTKVDHELAKTMLTNRDDSSVIQLFSDYNTRKISTETLSEIGQKYSPDVATLFFVEKIYEQDKNKRTQNYYLSGIDTSFSGDLEQQLSFLQNYYIVFVPGLGHKHIEGANFLDQRRLLDSAGISCEMIQIHEGGLIEENADIVARRVDELSKLHKNIIVISVSKGGLETARAFEMLSNAENISSIKAWINVCGILKGSPVADLWLPPLKRWWLSCGLFCIGKKVDLKALLMDISYSRCRKKYKTLKIPSEIITINLIAAPLAQLKKNKKIPIPNDGFSPLADLITEDGIVVIEAGLDHFLRGIDLNKRMAVLLRYIVDQVNNSTIN